MTASIQAKIIPFFEPKKLKVRDVTARHIQVYVDFKLETVSPNTVRHHITNLSTCFKSAIEQRLITFNPVDGVKKPKKQKYTGAQFYNEQQIDELLTATKGDIIEGVILFAAFYGLRRSEAYVKQKLKFFKVFKADDLTVCLFALCNLMSKRIY